MNNYARRLAELGDSERWIPGFEGAYAVDSDGNLISFKRGKKRFLIGGLDKDGYRKAILCNQGNRTCIRISSVIALAFIGDRPEGMVVRHLDGNKLNNRPENLEYSTQKDNIHDKYAHGTMQVGEKHWKAKLTEEDVVAIRKSKKPSAHLARELGVSKTAVGHARTGITWGHVK
ncbi:HNH endonuclease [Shewanella algae]|uniref:HNH endonuclease n=1 Tax=Shewanella algae TaxID=38313 RepID=UPI0034D76CCB